MPWIVAPINPSSLCAGTTTDTRFPSSMGRSYDGCRLRRRPAEAAVGDHCRDRAEDQADQGADDQRGVARMRRCLEGAARRDDLRALDLLCERQLLLQRLLLRDQVAEPRLRVVLLPDKDELLERVQVLPRALRTRYHRQAPVDRGDLIRHVVERLLERADLEADVRGGRPQDDEPRERVGRLLGLGGPRAVHREQDERARAHALSRHRVDLAHRHVPAQRTRAQTRGSFGLALRGRGADDLLNGLRIRPEAVDERTPRRGRLAERDERGRLEGLTAAGGDEHTDDRTENEPGYRQPPERDEGAAPAREIELALGVEVYRHRGLTLPEPAYVTDGTAPEALAPRSRTAPAKLRAACGRRRCKPECRRARARRQRSRSGVLR